MEYIISILTCIGTSIVLYFAYIRGLKKELKINREWNDELFEDYQSYKFLYEVQNDEVKELREENKKLRSKGMYKVKKHRTKTIRTGVISTVNKNFPIVEKITRDKSGKIDIKFKKVGRPRKEKIC